MHTVHVSHWVRLGVCQSWALRTHTAQHSRVMAACLEPLRMVKFGAQRGGRFGACSRTHCSRTELGTAASGPPHACMQYSIAGTLDGGARAHTAPQLPYEPWHRAFPFGMRRAQAARATAPFLNARSMPQPRRDPRPPAHRSSPQPARSGRAYGARCSSWC